MSGILVALEGPKSVGKTTLIGKLRQQTTTPDWLFTKEPTDSFNLGNEQKYAGEDLAARIALDRARHVENVIRPALDEDRVVVTDRYILSSFVFHCLDGTDEDTVRRLNSQYPHPDIMLVLLCSPPTLELRRSQIESRTRLSNAIPPEREILGYLRYLRACRSPSTETLICYNEEMRDCEYIAQKLAVSVAVRRHQS
ncbi:dTMP kinase [Fodinicola acaciae]|uniref:dTMP kinase n=1 Tax=Fodinicola acaciae TaxID=2681555 RepID=UPI0013D33E94|nr:AAA family ATPase [Fodinicola acaciae]